MPKNRFTFGHSHGAGRGTIIVRMWQAVVPGETIAWTKTLNQTDTLKAFKEEVIEGISLDSAQWSDRLVITTSAPTAADPGWFEHAHLDEEMPLRQLDFSWYDYARESNVDQQFILNVLLYERDLLHDWYKFGYRQRTTTRPHPLHPLVLRDDLLLLRFNKDDVESRTLSIDEYVKQHEKARKKLGEPAADEVGP